MKTKQKNFFSEFQNTGFTLIEVAISIVIISIIVVTIMSMFGYALRLLNENRLRTQAITLTEQKIEIIKNLPYNDVGTVGGIPPGALPQEETINYNGSSFTVKTQIIYIDDPADGILGVDPSELSGTDYKKIKIEVSWEGYSETLSVIGITNIAPRRNQDETGTGTLSILVFDANGNPVPQAEVYINAAIGTTTIDIDSQTNDQGRLIFPGAPAGLNAYQIVTTKEGYSTDRTCSIDASGSSCTDAEGNPEPTKPNASVISGELTEIGFSIDLLSNAVIKTIRQAVPSEWTINSDTTAFDQDNPSMTVCGNGNYIFTWRDLRQNNNPRIFAQMYDTNRVKQWDPDLNVTTSNNQNNPDVAVDANCNTYVTWNDDSNGNQEIYFEKFDMSPISVWGGTKKVNTAADPHDQTFPQIFFHSSSTYSYITWLDNRSGNIDMFVQKFDQNGIQQWTPEKQVNAVSAPGDGTSTYFPRIALDEMDNIYFLWADNRDGDNDIFAQKMDSTGLQLWAGDTKINSSGSGTDQKSPSFIISSTSPAHIYAVWQDDRNGNFDIYAQKFNLDGQKIWVNDLRVNIGGSDSIQENPVIVEDFSHDLYIVWQDNRNGDNDIYMQKIDPDGNILIEHDTRINISTAGEQENPDIYINSDGYLTVVWQDNAASDYDVRAGVYGMDPETITPVANVPVTITIDKQIGNNPVLYKFQGSYFTDSEGILNILGIEWGNYTITTNGYNILVTEPDQPVHIDPNETVEIILNLE